MDLLVSLTTVVHVSLGKRRAPPPVKCLGEMTECVDHGGLARVVLAYENRHLWTQLHPGVSN